MQPPHRPDLRDLPAFAERFYIEDVATPDESPSGRQGWEYVYLLKPRSSAVRGIPSFPLVYYQPGMVPASKGFMTRWAPSIELQVRPRAEVNATDLQGAKPLISPPATVYDFVQGAEVLRRQEVQTLPGPVPLAVLALAPPLGCVAWFLVWRRLYPDAARRTSQRRSRAARVALRRLRAAANAPPGEQAERASAIVADYLRERFEFPAAEPTPVEVAAHLHHSGMPAPLGDHASRFFQKCDAMRFHPTPNPDWSACPAAVALVLALEAVPCES
jgi:hypothetical protein